MYINVPLPKKKHLLRLTLYNVPSESVLCIGHVKIKLHLGINVINFAKRLEVIKKKLQLGEVLNPGLLFTCSIVREIQDDQDDQAYHAIVWDMRPKLPPTKFDDKNFQGLYCFDDLRASIRTVPIDYNYTFEYKGLAIKEKLGPIKIPKKRFDKLIIDNVPLGAKLEYRDGFICDLVHGRNVIDFRKMLVDAQIVIRQCLAGTKSFRDLKWEKTIVYIAGLFDGAMLDWKNIAWFSLDGSRNPQTIGEHFYVVVYPETKARCDWITI